MEFLDPRLNFFTTTVTELEKFEKVEVCMLILMSDLIYKAQRIYIFIVQDYESATRKFTSYI